MKKITIFTAILMLCAFSIFAQSPEKFTYQAVVRNANNTLICNAPVGVRVSILQDGVSGTLAFMETHTAVTNANGLVTIVIGGGNLQQGAMSDIQWGSSTVFLKTEIDPDGGSNYTITTTQQLLSVPYALYSKEAGNGFSGDYNDLTNTPDIPTVPANVSAFANDAGYLTSFTEQQILSISNDTIFLTGGSFVKLPEGFDGDYNSLSNTPAIPTIPVEVSAFINDAGYITMDSVPTNVSAFTNDAGYLTDYTETDPEFNAWDKSYNDLTNKPTIPTVPVEVSAFANDAGYITMDSVPTNVSAFTNDAGYLTDYTETDPEFNAWDKDYNDLTNKPNIPTVPVEVSAFANDAGYITMDSVPANVSAFINDAGYLTGYTETDPLFNAWDKDYNDLTNKPNIPTVPVEVSAFVNDAGYITGYTETDPEFNAWDKDYNDLTNKPTIPNVPANVSAFVNDAGYITSYTETQSLADVTSHGNSAGNRQLKNVSDPTEAYDAVNLHTLNLKMDSLMAKFQEKIDSLEDVINSLIPNNPDTNNFVCGTSTVSDIDGNVYNTVKIGNQCWMRENLRTTLYRDGSAIPNGGDATSSTQPYYYDYSSHNLPLVTRGYLYNWPAAMEACPLGWHLPSDEEWTIMESLQTTIDVAGTGIRGDHAGKLSSIGWYSSTTTGAPGNVTEPSHNASGFGAVPAGTCNGSSFDGAGLYTRLWSSTVFSGSPLYARFRGFTYDESYVLNSNSDKYHGYSVRCLRD